MKPSDIILAKIRKNLGKNTASEYELISGIMMYLDEQYEKEQSKNRYMGDL